MSNREVNKRAVSFRMPEDIVRRLIEMDKLPEDFDRKTLSAVALEIIADAIEGSIPPSVVEEQTKRLDYITKLLEGKQSPQAA